MFLAFTFSALTPVDTFICLMEYTELNACPTGSTVQSIYCDISSTSNFEESPAIDLSSVYHTLLRGPIIVSNFVCNFLKESIVHGNLLLFHQRFSRVVIHSLCLWRVCWYWTIKCDAAIQLLVTDMLVKIFHDILCYLI